MSTPKSTTRMDQIRKQMKSHPKGIWLKELAEQIGVHTSTILYYLRGKYQRGEEMGGYMRNEWEIVKKEGNNIFVRLKK